MDKLAKRAGVTALVVVVAAGSAFAVGMVRYASSLERERVADTPQLAAALRLPLPAPPTLVVPLVVEAPQPQSRLRPADPPNARKAQRKPAPANKLAVRSPPLGEARDLTPEPVADDMLDLDFGGGEREAKLAEHGANAFGARQLGGAEEKHRRVIPGQRVTFETDLAKPQDY